MILHGSTRGIESLTITNCARSFVTTLDQSRDETSHDWPVFLPGGRRFVYLVRSGRRENAGVYQSSLDGGPSVRVVGADSPVALSAGHLLTVDDAALWARPYDFDQPEKIGEARRVQQGVGYFSSRSEAAFTQPRVPCWRTGKRLGTAGSPGSTDQVSRLGNSRPTAITSIRRSRPMIGTSPSNARTRRRDGTLSGSWMSCPGPRPD